MKSKVGTPSNKHSCSRTAAPSQCHKDESICDAFDEKLILQCVYGNTRTAKSSHFYYGATARDESASSHVSKTRMESPTRACTSCSADVSLLSAAANKLQAEVDSLRSANSALKQRNALLNASLANLSAQFNCTLAQQQSVQANATRYTRENAGLQQRIAFTEQKLEQYITRTFESEERAEELEARLSSAKRAFDAQLAQLKAKLSLDSDKARVRTNSSLSTAKELSSSIVSAKYGTNAKPSNSTQAFALSNVTSRQEQAYAELLTAVRCLFKDKCNGETWSRVRALVGKRESVRATASS